MRLGQTQFPSTADRRDLARPARRAHSGVIYRRSGTRVSTLHHRVGCLNLDEELGVAENARRPRMWDARFEGRKHSGPRIPTTSIPPGGLTWSISLLVALCWGDHVAVCLRMDTEGEHARALHATGRVPGCLCLETPSWSHL
jgi:hypothetical protein